MITGGASGASSTRTATTRRSAGRSARGLRPAVTASLTTEPSELAGEPFRAQLRERLVRLLEPVETHAAEHLGRLRELDLPIVDDLQVVAPWVAEAEVGRPRHLDAGFRQRGAGGVLV